MGYSRYPETLEGAIVRWGFRGQAVSWRGTSNTRPGGWAMKDFLGKLWSQEEGQDSAEYAVMLAVILVIVVGTIRLIGSNSNNVFSSVASSISQ
jgi:Flp pilus assembly pilin Flp